MTGNLAIETINQVLTAIVDRSGFGAVEINFADLHFEARQRCVRVIGGAAVDPKEIGGNLVHQIIARLCGENQCDEQFERIFVIEIELRIGMRFLEARQNLFEPRRCFGRFD